MSESSDQEIEYAKEVFENDDKIDIKSSLGVFNSGKLEDKYRVGGVIGKGGFGTVYRGIRKQDRKMIALKQISKRKVSYKEKVNISQYFP